MYKITAAELLDKSDVKQIPAIFHDNFLEFLVKVNQFRMLFGKPMSPTSFFRSQPKQIAIYKNKAKKKEFPFTNGVFDAGKVPMGSAHMKAAACDFADPHGEIGKWFMAHKNILPKLGLYVENPTQTKGWFHVQSVAPASGNHIFNP